MKILAIRGKNLASLEGEFEIDFTKEPLCSVGIFAITGSTGSGKSTILDAICLALYNDTPRVNRAVDNADISDVKEFTVKQKDCRNILRRGTADAYAEVEFVSLSGDRYCSRWSVRRSRDKSDGSLQNSTFSVFNITTSSELKGTKTELLKRIIDLVGLSFDQFTRSVLLAQGDFATFLKAPQREKAELLEKLTGTDIYSRISAKIYENTKLAEADLSAIKEKVKGVEVLTSEQIELLQKENDDLQKEVSSLDNVLNIANDKLKWIDRDEQLSNDLRNAKVQLVSINDEEIASKDRADSLALIESVQDIRDDFRALENDKKRLAESENKLREQKSFNESNSIELKSLKLTLAECDAKRRAFVQDWKKLEPQIKDARALDVMLNESLKQLTSADKDLLVAIDQKSKCAKAIEHCEKEISSSKNKLQDIDNWFSKNEIYKEVVTRIELVTTYIEDSSFAKKQELSNSKLLESSEVVLGNEQKLLDSAKKEIDRLNNILPEEIAVLRAKLVEGEPCLVCGSIHHPNSADAVVESLEEKVLNESKSLISAEITRLSEGILNRQNENIRLKSLIGTYAEQFNSLYAKLLQILSCIPDWENKYSNGTLSKELKDISKQWNDNTLNYTNIELQLGALGQELKTLNSRLNEVSLIEEDVKSRRDAKLQECDGLNIKRSAIFNGRQADIVENEFLTASNKATDAFNIANEKVNLLIAKGEKLLGAISQIELLNNQLEANIKKLNYSVNSWLSKRIDELSYDKLGELLSKDSEWLMRERLYFDDLNMRNIAAKTMTEERDRVWTEHQNLVSKPLEEENKESLSLLVSEVGEQLNAKRKRVGEIAILFTNDEKGKAKIKQFEKEIAEQESITINWQKLNELLGSADGAKFKVIAQGYTLDILLSYANKHLQNITQRYLLERVSVDSLSLQVIDLDMFSEVRSVHSLSGGESFLISLALALGLSSLSSNKMRIESLFIDEGFGSLDADTLRVAMDALEHLQTQGRKIGVISHVAEMTERIPTQIQVIKTINGRSRVLVVGR